MDYTDIIIPRPVSVNAMYRSDMQGGKRYKSSKYRDFISSGLYALGDIKGMLIDGMVYIDLLVPKYGGGCQDIDNRIKPSLDLLVRGKVIKDDSQVMGISAEWIRVDSKLKCSSSIMRIYYGFVDDYGDILGRGSDISEDDRSDINFLRMQLYEYGKALLRGE